MQDIHRQAFREEAADLLTELEAALLELEENPSDAELVNRVFRAMHTLKGSGAMFGFDDVAHFTHEVETVFDKVRSGQLELCKPLLDLAFRASDHVTCLLNNDGGDLTPFLPEGDAILLGLHELSGCRPEQVEQPSGDTSEDVPGSSETPAEGGIFRVRIKPSPAIYSSGANPEFFLEDLRALGEASVFAHLEDIPPLSALDPEECRIWWDVLLTGQISQAQIRDVFRFAEDDCEVSVTPVSAGEGHDFKRLGEILVERGDIDPDKLAKALSSQKRLGTILTEAGILPGVCVDAALAEQDLVKERREARNKAPETASSLRVPAEKLDLLQDLVGELVIVQAQIRQIAPTLKHSFLLTLSEQLERLSDDIRDSTLAIRMLPIGSTFGTYRRLVRDLSAETGKLVELVTSGEETELDKSLLDKLGEALVHLVRNAVDHGLEPPDERQAAGKPRQGRVELCAEHSGGDVVILVKDDGRGIDPERVRAKAVERGLVSAGAELGKAEILELIFEPGFSTARTVSSVSGRGVGMDVVKRVINSMRGSIEIASEKGAGCEVTIRLPLTLAIIDGLQVRVAGQGYVIPLDVVEECVELDRASLEGRGTGNIINLRGEAVPYIPLRRWFGSPGRPPAVEQVVVMRLDGMRVGMAVDSVVGEHQTVIKSLGPVFRKLEGFSGATIQGDGSMSLILDVKCILRLGLGEKV